MRIHQSPTDAEQIGVNGVSNIYRHQVGRHANVEHEINLDAREQRVSGCATFFHTVPDT
jgi:hypothetical protein